MPTEQVLFHVPTNIQAGLLSGQYERIGGVIRQQNTKEVVAWLRESPTLQSQQLNSFLGSTSLAKALSIASATTLMLSLSLTAMQITDTKKLLARIIDLSDRLQIEQDEARQDKFNTAINAFNDMIQAKNERTQYDRAKLAIQRFEELVEEFVRKFDAIITTNVEQAVFYVQQAMLSSSYRAKAYSHINETDLAKQYIEHDISTFHKATNLIVDQFIGEHFAVFFHKDIETANLSRFLHIMETWKQMSLFEVVAKSREDFWNSSIIREPFYQRLRNIRKSSTFNDEIVARLNQIEIAIENFNRIQSIDMEIKYLRLSNQTYKEWHNKVTAEDMNNHQIAILHLSEPIALASD